MKVTIIAAVLTTTELTLYQEDGTALPAIKQGDPRLAPLIKRITPFVSVGKPIEVDLKDIVASEASNYFSQMEEKSSGVVRFFRIAKQRLTDIFAKKDPFIDPCVIGKVPEQNGMQKEVTSVVNEIMSNAKSSTAADFKVPNLNDCNETDTLVAIVDNKVIPDVHNLGGQIKAAVDNNNSVGLLKLMQRVAAVTEIRSHSVEDLMKFMRRGDLPVTDNGEILVYKALKRVDWSAKYAGGFHYADIHSKNVPQKVGSYVFMSEGLVDPNRNNECSNGLHIARRQYLSSFHGDVCVIALIRPEDVIAVPSYDANKMRVCGYHIIHELTDDQYNSLLRNEPITDDEDGQLLLGKLLAGQHIGVTSKVEITKSNGGGIIIHDLNGGNQEEQVSAETELKAEEAPRMVKAIEELQVTAANDISAEPVDPKAVAMEAAANIKKPASTRKQQAAVLAEAVAKAASKKDAADAARELLKYKKKAKVAWCILGLDDDMTETLTKLLD